MIANEELIHQVNKVRLPYNLNSISQSIALQGIKNKMLVKARIKAITDERRRLFDRLASLPGISPYPSEANFILFKTANAAKIFQGLLKRGVLVKNMDKVISNTIRVTVGSPNENNLFIGSLKKALQD
jgi:histidinol-phosphate aminotransferase